jgi:hypothetical protein
METKFTKGKWSYAESSNEVDYLVYVDGLPCLFISLNYGVDPKYIDKEETEANAKLIAAAPDMLEALNEMVKNLSSYVYGLKIRDGFSELLALENAKKAIKKATE